MKNKIGRIVLVGLAVSAAACSGAGDDPPPFAESSPAASGLAARLSADLGTPVVAEVVGRMSYALVAEKTRVLARGNDRDAKVLEWVKGYAGDLGVAPETLAISSEGDDALGLHHVMLSPVGPELEGGDAGIEVTTDGEGRFVALSGHLPPDLGPLGLSKADAERSAKATLAIDGETPEIVSTALETHRPGESASDDAASLTYRVTTRLVTLWVDAKTGEVLAMLPNTENVQAFSAEEAFQAPIPAGFLRPGKSLEVETMQWDANTHILSGLGTGAHLVVKSLDGFSADGVPIETGPIASTDRKRFDVGYSAYQGRGKPRSHDGVADQIAVDAFHNVALADTFFRTRLGRGPGAGLDGAFGDGLEIVVHANVETHRSSNGKLVELDGRNNASFSTLTKKVYFGDGWLTAAGANASVADNQRLPTALGLDVVGHELTHAFAGSRAEPGEVGALNEGVADVIGQIFERSVEGNARSAATVGERIWPNGHGRNLAHPERGLPRNLFKATTKQRNDIYPNHVETQLCAKVIKGKVTRDRPTLENDYGCIHDNSLIVSHAYYLMSFGGFNSRSHVQVDGAKSVAAAENLWLATLGIIGQKGFIPTPVRDFASLARFQIAAAYATSPAEARSVACAWHAVGVIDKRTVDALGVTCNTLPYESCWLPGPNGTKLAKPDGIYCNETYETSSYGCVGGSLKGGSSCITGQACVVRNPLTREAMLSPTGEAACESAYP